MRVKSLTAKAIFCNQSAGDRSVTTRRHYTPLSPANALHYLRESARLASRSEQFLAIDLLRLSARGSLADSLDTIAQLRKFATANGEFGCLKRTFIALDGELLHPGGAAARDPLLQGRLQQPFIILGFLELETSCDIE
jgi:hypothetical protein